MRITLQETTFLMNEIAQQKNWCDLTMVLIRDTRDKINAGIKSDWADLVIRYKAKKNRESKKVERTSSGKRRAELLCLIEANPRKTVKYYADELGVEREYISAYFYSLFSRGMLVRWKNKNNAYVYCVVEKNKHKGCEA